MHLLCVNFNAGAANALAGEVALLGLHEDDLAIDSSVDREVAAHESARASKFRSAGLADENFVLTVWPPKRLTPRRWPALLWMFLLVPPALTCDILYFFLNTII